jgi:hypothetical protein
MQIRDPEWKKFGSGMEKTRIRDKHPGSATLPLNFFPMMKGYQVSTWVLVGLLVLSTSLLATYTCLSQRNRRKITSGRPVYIEQDRAAC